MKNDEIESSDQSEFEKLAPQTLKERIVDFTSSDWLRQFTSAEPVISDYKETIYTVICSDPFIISIPLVTFKMLELAIRLNGVVKSSEPRYILGVKMPSIDIITICDKYSIVIDFLTLII